MMSQTVVVINNMEICRKDFGEKEENMHVIWTFQELSQSANSLLKR